MNDSAGAPINFSGYSGIGQIKANLGASGVFAQFGVSFSSTVSGGVNLSLSESTMTGIPAGQCVYALDVSRTGASFRALRGYLGVYPDYGFGVWP